MRPVPVATTLEHEQASAQNHQIEVEVAKRKLEEEANALNAELRSLQSHPSNIPSNGLQLRTQLCSDLGIDADALPFAGELVQVRARRDRLGRGGRAGTSQLRCRCWSLPAITMQWPCGWTSATSGPDSSITGCQSAWRPPRRPDRQGGHPLLLDMLEIKAACGFDAWLLAELARRANHACVESIADFRTAAKAVTRSGRLRTGSGTRRTTAGPLATAASTCSGGATSKRSRL